MAIGHHNTNKNATFKPIQIHKSNEQNDYAYPPTVVLHGGGPPNQYENSKHNK